MADIIFDAKSQKRYYRETVFTARTCLSCGKALSTWDGHRYLFRFWKDPVGVSTKKIPLDGLFCSIDCARSYGALK